MLNVFDKLPKLFGRCIDLIFIYNILSVISLKVKKRIKK